jgi:hypothetical protein
MQSEPIEHKLKIESTQAARKENKVFFLSILSSTFFQTFWLPPAVAHSFGVPSDSIQWWWRQRCCFAKSAVDLFELNES